MLKRIVVLLLFVQVSFGQNDYKLGNYNKLVNKNIEFQFKEPLSPFEKIQESYSIQGNKNLVTAYYAKSSNNIVALQIYASTIPKQFGNINWNEMIASKTESRSFLNSFLGASANSFMKVSEHSIKSINGKRFLEVKSTLTASGVVQKQINWITVYKNTFINVLGATLENSFDKYLSFFKDFSSSILIK